MVSKDFQQFVPLLHRQGTKEPRAFARQCVAEGFGNRHLAARAEHGAEQVETMMRSRLACGGFHFGVDGGTHGMRTFAVGLAARPLDFKLVEKLAFIERVQRPVEPGRVFAEGGFDIRASGKPSRFSSSSTSGVTLVSSHTINILGWREASNAANSASNFLNFANPARTIIRWPSDSTGCHARHGQL